MSCLHKAYVFPVVQDNLCALHLRDRDTPLGHFATPISLPPVELQKLSQREQR